MQSHDAGTVVTAYGLHFRNSPELTVMIGNYTAQATYVSDSVLTFIPPKVLENDTFPVRVSGNTY
jgi:hypothetical protein